MTCIFFITQDFHEVQILTNNLCGDNFLLVKKKLKMDNFFLFQCCVIKQFILLSGCKSKRKF